MTVVCIDTRRIKDWDSFHSEFATAFGFPDSYGRNMNAWIDCMTYLDDPDVADTAVKADPGGVVALQLDHASDFHARCPELHDALVEASAYVNWRRLKLGRTPVIALSFDRNG